MKQHILDTFPEILDIQNDDLRTKVIETWVDTLQYSGFRSLSEIPFTMHIPDVDQNFVEHTKRVTSMAKAVAEQREDVNMDLVIAGALLNDIGKLLEYEPAEHGVRKSKFGELIRHPFSGVWLAMKHDLPVEVAHILGVHAQEGYDVDRIPEAVVVHYCNKIDYDITSYRMKRNHNNKPSGNHDQSASNHDDPMRNDFPEDPGVSE